MSLALDLGVDDIEAVSEDTVELDMEPGLLTVVVDALNKNQYTVLS